MASEPLLAFEKLLAPIPGENPAGEAVSFAVRAEMEEARKEIDPSDFEADDPLRPTEAKKADWKGIARLATQTLLESSKDLLVAARLTEAMTKLYGFEGLADGLQLLRRLLDECWDRLHPTIEDGDLEARAGPFNWLGDDARGARFPYTVRTIPLFKGDNGWYTLRDWKTIQENRPGVTRDEFERAMTAATREDCQKLVDAIGRVIEEMTRLLEVLNQRLGKDAPAMTDLRAAFSESQLLCKQALSRKGAAEVVEAASEETTEEAAPAAGPKPTTAARAMATRADVYARLGEAADLLERLEPHSPVPYLIRRAVALGRLPFPQMMKALMREEFKNALAEMNRELGIVESDPATKGEEEKKPSSGW